MDETSEAAATRKRRSSILKSQRAARTPFSELEFHVATPTDTTKSRRVSFSRRTGVAEFATNEATTTWKNFYEEHNKSLESSGNDSSANASKQNLGHIGKRIFDQQFEEVDAADFMGSLNPGYNINSSISNLNFAQLTSMESTDDVKLSELQTNFELSAFTTNHSKLFNNDITVPVMGEMSERIDINFSAVQNIGEKDDLDEIQKDLKNQGNVICHGPFRDRQNLSEYIEIDLNSTHAVLRNDESDNMSITDTIHSPKVQEISKSISIEKIVNNDWETDKENIAFNPYVTPKESVNFAINDESDKVLVFDGKRLTIQSETVPNKSISRQTITPAQIETPKAAQRKTITLNVNDDLPNFINDPSHASGYLSVAYLKKHTELDSSMSITNPITNIDQTQRLKTVQHDDDIGDISLTQAISSNIVQEKRRTIVFEDSTSNISITQAMPTNIIDKIEKRRTILYDNDTGNISITQALPTNEIRNTVVYENEDRNLSMTQALPANIITEKALNKRKTIVYEDGGCNLSITQAVPNIVISVKSPEKSCSSEDGPGNMSVTQAIPSNIIIEENLKERRRTVVLERNIGNISITQAVPASFVYTHNPNANIPIVDLKPPNKLSDNEINRRRTVVFENDAGNLSITEAVSSNVISNLKPQESKRKTIVFDDEEADISITQAVPMNKLISFTNEEKNKVFNNTDKRNTIVFNNEEAEMLVTQTIDQIISGFENTISKNMPENECAEKRCTIVFDDDNADISMTQVVDMKHIIPKDMNRIKDTSHRNVVKDTVCDEADVSMSEVVSPTQVQGKCIIFDDDVFLVHDEPTHHVAPKKSNINEILDISMDEDVKTNTQDSAMFKEFNKSAYDLVAKENEIDIPVEDASISKPIPHNLSQIQDGILEKSLKQYYKAAKNELLDHTANVSQVLVYQMSQSGQLVSKGIEKQDSKIQPPAAVLSDEGIAPVDPKIDDLKENKKPVIETVLSATKINEGVVDITTDDKNYSSVMEIEIDSKPSQKNYNMEMSYSESPPQEVTGTKVVSLQSFTTNVPDVSMSHSPSKSEVKKKESILNDLLDMSTSTLGERPTDQTKIESYVESKDLVVSGKDQEVMTQTKMESYTEPKDSGLFGNKEEVTTQTKMESYTETKDSEVSNNKEEVMTQTKMDSYIDQTGSLVSGSKEEDMKESSNDTLFYITKDDDEEVSKDLPQIEHIPPLPLEFKEERPLVDKLQKKLALLKTVFGGGGIHKNKNKKEDSRLEDKEKSVAKNLSKCNKNFKLANDTSELLDMLSDFTDNRTSPILDPHLEVDEEKPEPIMIKGHLALENKSETETEPRRINFAPGRPSIVLSREDIMNNISMAGAALQKSRLELDESDSMDETTKESPDINVSTKKNVRLSKEVIKILQFDEDSASEVSDSNIQASPLKKTAFGETSYMTENRANVIPSYIHDVTDGIKELMHDLVKPMADNVPFDASGTLDRINKKTASTCSVQIQANLITSSQIDIDTELYSNSESINDLQSLKTSSAEIIKDAVRRSMIQSVKSPIKSVTIMAPGSDKSMDAVITSRSASPDRVIVFDHSNPLNNILLPPPEHRDIHRYNPVKSTDTICALDPSQSSEVVSTQLNVRNLISYSRQGNDMKTDSTYSNVSKPGSTDRSENTQSDLKDTEVNTLIVMKGNKELLEASSSLTLVDDTIHHIDNPEKKHSPVKLLYRLDEDELPEKDSDLTSNEDLIQSQTKAKKRIYSPANDNKHKYCTLSSLDVTPKPLSKMQKISEKSFKQDKIEKPTKLKADRDDCRIDIKRIPSPTKSNSSPTRRIPSPTKIMLSPTKRMPSPTKIITYPTKRNPSPTKVMPSPTKRMPSPTKIIPYPTKRIPSPTIMIPSTKRMSIPTKQELNRVPSPTKQHKRKGDHDANITVHHAVTEFILNDNDNGTLVQQIKEAPNIEVFSAEHKSVSISNSDLESLDMVSSFTSSKNLGRDDQSTVTSSGEHRLSDDCSGMEWQDNDEYTRNYVSDCDSSVNIVAKIDMLPFMGSHECEWESSIGDTWSFRLLHSCLRLTVRLQHRHENGTRTCVRADTPLLHSQIETIHTEKKNPIAVLCVRFAGEAMRYEVSHASNVAGGVPALVRRCAAIARLATRWARIMHDTRARLAYSLTQDGILAIKVANIPLRSVWEVRLKIELVVSEAGCAPYPRAAPLSVARVLAERPVHARELRHLVRDLPSDWGHAPRTIWRIFKHLKHKKREDEFLEINY